MQSQPSPESQPPEETNSARPTSIPHTRSAGRSAAIFLGGILAGALVMAIAVAVVMPRLMIVTEAVDTSVDETVQRLQTSLEKQGWSSPGVMNMNEAMAKHGISFDPQVRVVQLCKAEYASAVLQDDRHVSCLMPCSISIWEGDDGRTYISKMNTGLMGKMFGGTIARIMGGPVAREEGAMIAALRK